MTNETLALAGTAATIGFVHTLLGPDHYIPFIAMSKARGWNAAKTGLITFLCGIGHVLSSVVLGFIGLVLGTAVLKLEGIESVRGDLAGWLLLGFGIAYTAWGIRRAILNRPHEHAHVHAADEGESHSHEHTHADDHAHPHAKPGSRNTTPWVLFTIFVFGPCEPLIPLLIYPAAKIGIASAAVVAAVFAVVTIGTMLACVMLAHRGLSFLRFSRIERYSHALAGATVVLCGGAILMGL
jgi:ABC-type nickel/cobalt efflux system permease component RcnA